MVSSKMYFKKNVNITQKNHSKYILVQFIILKANAFNYTDIWFRSIQDPKSFNCS